MGLWEVVRVMREVWMWEGYKIWELVVEFIGGYWWKLQTG